MRYYTEMERTKMMPMGTVEFEVKIPDTTLIGMQMLALAKNMAEQTTGSRMNIDRYGSFKNSFYFKDEMPDEEVCVKSKYWFVTIVWYKNNFVLRFYKRTLGKICFWKKDEISEQMDRAFHFAEQMMYNIKTGTKKYANA